LRPELEYTDPERHRALLLRAASWHEERGDVTAAIGYIVRARAWDELLELTRVHGRDAFQQGLAATVRAAVDAIPIAVRLASRPAMFTRATLHLLTGQVDVANEELHRLGELHDLSPQELAVVDVERTAMVAWNLPPDEATVTGRRALERLAALDADSEPIDVLGLTSLPMLEIVTLVALGRAEHYLGRDDEARDVLDRAAARSEGVFLPWYLHSLGARALVEAMSGNLRAATELAARVMHAAAGAGIDAHPATAEARLAIAVVRREQDELDDASFALDEAGALIRSSRRGSLQCLYLAESAWLGLALGATQPPVPELEPFRTLPAFSARLAAARVRQRLSVRDIEGAALAIAAHGGPKTVDVDLAEVAVAVARRELSSARRLVDDVDHDAGARAVVEQAMWRAVIDDLEGDGQSAGEQFGVAIAAAEEEDLRRVLLDAGPDVMRLVRRHFERSPTPFLRAIVERHPAGASRAVLVPELVEQLTDREMAVLRYLPTRLSNVEIAQRLYVSLNTVKTHLKHIYRKLGATSRTDAIERAGRLGLL
jgi:LuxR family maltose regulon positive regulatory protein